MSGGRFTKGRSGNPRGRPSTEQRARRTVEQTLLEAGATQADIDRIVAASTGSSIQAAAAIALMCALVAVRREQQNTPCPLPTQT